MDDPATVANLLSVGNMLAGAAVLGFSWMLKIIFGRMRELHQRSVAADKRIEGKVDETATQRVEVDRELYKEILGTKVDIAFMQGEHAGYIRGLDEGRRG